MNLEIFNTIANTVKENNVVQNFMKELGDYLEKVNNSIEGNDLKQEGTLYQVVEMGIDGAYLQNTNNNRVSEEKDISKDILNKMGNDTVLRYQDGKYIIEEELTQKFFDSLVEIKKYKEMQNDFMRDSNILEMEPETKYYIERREEKDSILNYGKDNTMRVPNELIPFWAKSGETLYYKNGKFERDLKWK